MQAETTEALIQRQGRCALLANVLILTQNMLDSARKAEWDVVTTQENDRRDLLRRCFEAPVTVEHSELFSEALAMMLHLNEELIAEVEHAKSNAAAQQIERARAHQGVSCYLDVEPLS